MVVLMALLMSGHYPQPKLLSLNDDSELNATLFMREHLKPASFVGAYAPKNVWMAKQNYIPMGRNALPPLLTDAEFSAWLKNNHLHAIYSDPMLKILEPAVWQLVQKHVGAELQVEFSSRDGKWQVLTARDVYDPDPSTFIDRPWYSSKPRFATEDTRSQPAMSSLIRKTGGPMITFTSLVLASFLGGIVALAGAVALLILLLHVVIEDEAAEKFKRKQPLGR
jgi:hypothetical protein